MTDTNDFISDRQTAILGATRDIVCAALHPDSGAIVPDVLDLLDKVHAKVTTLVDGPAEKSESASEKATQSEIRKSIKPDGLISFIDGHTYQTLRRHLRTHGETPESYRARFGLSPDYPMVAANYSARRSELAKALGLGQIRKPDAAAPPAAPAPKVRRAKALEPA